MDEPTPGRPEADRQLDAILRKPLTRRTALQGAAVGAAAVTLAACSKDVGPGGAQTTATSSGTPQLEDTLNLYNWSAYFSPDNQKAFEQEYGVTINEDNYASNEELIAKLQGGAKGYDIVAPTGYAVETLIAGNLLLPLDLSRIPNLQNTDPQFQDAGFDPGNAHSVPKDWGTTGVGYLTDFVKDDITSWAQFYDLASQYSGRYTVLDSSPEVIGSALKLLGFSYNTLDQGEIDQATDKLISIKPYIYDVTSSKYRQEMSREDTYVALGWNGDFFYVKPPHTYVIPSEGSEFWLDNWAIPATAAHPNLAHEFLNWILTPEHQATESSYTYYASCVPAAKDLIDKVVANDPAIYPSQATIAKLETAVADPQFLTTRNDAWTKFQSA